MLRKNNYPKFSCNKHFQEVIYGENKQQSLSCSENRQNIQNMKKYITMKIDKLTHPLQRWCGLWAPPSSHSLHCNAPSPSVHLLPHALACREQQCVCTHTGSILCSCALPFSAQLFQASTFGPTTSAPHAHSFLSYTKLDQSKGFYNYKF